MAIFNFLFGNREPSGFTLSGEIELDADLTISETHERNAETTDHSIEDGSIISDHIILQPERVQLEGFITDTVAAILAHRPGKTQDAFDILDFLWRNRQPVTLITGMKVYDNMVITSLSLPRERPSSMIFKIELKQIVTVESEFGLISDPNVSDSVSPPLDAGRQVTNAAGERTSQRASSVLSGILGGP